MLDAVTIKLLVTSLLTTFLLPRCLEFRDPPNSSESIQFLQENGSKKNQNGAEDADIRRGTGG